MEDLIKRLEATTGPDRELDDRIWRFVNDAKLVRGWQYDIKEPPAYTESIDAALTLVPEGFTWYVDGGRHACVWRDDDQKQYGGARDMPTPVIALCVAALKARQAAIPPHERGI